MKAKDMAGESTEETIARLRRENAEAAKLLRWALLRIVVPAYWDGVAVKPDNRYTRRIDRWLGRRGKA